MSKKTLPALIEDSLALDQLLLEADGDISNPDVEIAINNWIAEITSGIALKVDGYEEKQISLKDKVAAFKARAEAFSNTAKALSNLSDSLKDRLKFAMTQLGTTELAGNLYKYKLSKSAASLCVIDESQIPQEYFKQKITFVVDKELIKADIDAGKSVPGVQLEYGFTLRVSKNKG